MSSAAITTIVKMVESLPNDLQERVSEHIREYIADLEDEAKWESSFQRSSTNLVAAARQAQQEIAEGKSVPMDYSQLWSPQRCPHFGLNTEISATQLEKEREKHIAFGLIIPFIPRYISSASTARKVFGRFE